MDRSFDRSTNNNNIEYREPLERVILVTIDPAPSANGSEAERSLDELAELAETAGAEVVFFVTQFREHPHPATYVGSGKLDEIRSLIEDQHATGIICDDELTPSQMKNLSEELKVKVMDRTMVILDIFARRAASREGKLQVELAQLRYTASHLTGMWTHLSRQEGGIGTRGPGEKQLEMDRRVISRQISRLKAELSEMVADRQVQRKKRSESRIPIGAIVGYTNAGKSTLLNTLTGANVLEEDQLFATLDPTTRSLTLSAGQKVLLTDTVGFVRKLPHHLIDAFRSTLEEAVYADFLIHVIDASDPQMEQQMKITYKTLEDLGVNEKPVITFFNKMDLAEPDPDGEVLRDPRAFRTIRGSLKQPGSAAAACAAAETRHTISDVDSTTTLILKALEDVLRIGRIYVERLYSYADAGRIQQIRKYGELISEDYSEHGIFVKAYIPPELS